VVQVTEAPAKEIGVVDILLGSLGITGLLLVGSAILGFLVAAVIFGLRRRAAERNAEASLASAQLHLTGPGAPPR
jgi:hypothetical protein